MKQLIACPLCSGPLASHLKSVRSVYSQEKAYDVDRCVTCACQFTNPCPEESDLADLYRNHYGHGEHSLIAEEKVWRARRLLLDLPEARRLLDIGCGEGYLLEAARSSGYLDSIGVELGSTARANAERKGFRVVPTLGELPRDAGSFDLIVLQHVLEHLVHDVDQLKEIRKICSPGGRLVIAVPNPESFTARWFRSAWGWYQVPVHLRHYSRQALAGAVKSAGWQLLEEKFSGGDSLFLMLTLTRAIGIHPGPSGSRGPNAFVKAVIGLWSRLTRGYAVIGSEERVWILTPVLDPPGNG